MSLHRNRIPGRGWAYTGVILGGVVSIAANVAHSFIPPVTAPRNWHPSLGAIGFSMAWPVLLFVAVEIFVKPAWSRGGSYFLLRWLGLLPVALVAGFVSYRHLAGLLLHYGEEPIVAYAGPIAVDGLMVMATGALLVTGRLRHPAPATLVAAVQPTSAPAAAPAAAPSGPAAPTPAPAPPSPIVVAAAPVSPALPVPTPAVVAQRITAPRPTSIPAAPAAVSRPGSRATRSRPNKAVTPAVRSAPSTTDTSVTASDAAQPTLPVVPPALLNRVKEVAAEYLTEHGTPITAGQLAVRLKVTSEQAGQALAVLNLGNTNPSTATRTVNGQPVRATR